MRRRANRAHGTRGCEGLGSRRSGAARRGAHAGVRARAPPATNSQSSSGIPSDQTATTCSRRRVTAWCAMTAPVEHGSMITIASPPAADRPAASALAATSGGAGFATWQSSRVRPSGRVEESARGVESSSHSTYSSSAPTAHAARTRRSSASCGVGSYLRTGQVRLRSPRAWSPPTRWPAAHQLMHLLPVRSHHSVIRFFDDVAPFGGAGCCPISASRRAG